jgi:succinate dehydrogenase / fumarate reductase, cytochrome b subunit
MERPLSPFMFPIWYRFQITSVLSILHRLTGIALAVGSILLAWWLVAVAAGGEVFAATHDFIASPIGVLLLFGWSVAFFYHLCSGIRHLAWDAGYGFEISTTYRSGYEFGRMDVSEARKLKTLTYGEFPAEDAPVSPLNVPAKAKRTPSRTRVSISGAGMRATCPSRKASVVSAG